MNLGLLQGHQITFSFGRGGELGGAVLGQELRTVSYESQMKGLSSFVVDSENVLFSSKRQLAQRFDRTYLVSSITLGLLSGEFSGVAFSLAMYLCASEKKTSFGLPTCG